MKRLMLVAAGSLAVFACAGLYQATAGRQTHVARDANPESPKPRRGHDVDTRPDDKVLDDLHKSGAKGESIATHVRLGAKHMYESEGDFLIAYQASVVAPEDDEIILPPANGLAVVFHRAKRGVPYLVDFSVESVGRGGGFAGNGSVQTQAPDGTTQAATFSGRSHLSVVVYPKKNGLYRAAISNTGDFRELIVHGVDISDIGR